MDFPLRTIVEIERPGWSLDYTTSALFIGSCFSDNIGGILQRFKFPVITNPYGVLYNPSSIYQALQLAIEKKVMSPNDLVRQGNLWHSFHFHGSFSDPDPLVVSVKCNETIEKTHFFLQKAPFLFVSFGTSWVYKHILSGSIVSNCHKISANQFERYRLNTAIIVEQWLTLTERLRTFNPDLKIVFTISPVRHLKDGAHGNQLSKSTLLLAVDEIIRNHDGGNLFYFPSYEILNDELRDYRFYNNDMTHLSDTAIQFIFEKFKETFFTSQTIDMHNEIKSIVQASEHKLLTNDQIAISQFAKSMLAKIQMLQIKYPQINFINEIEQFSAHIN